MDEGNDEDRLECDDGAQDPAKRLERKRHREKQRRSELASAFDELASLLMKIELEQDLDAPSMLSSTGNDDEAFTGISGHSTTTHSRGRMKRSCIADDATKRGFVATGPSANDDSSGGTTRIALITKTIETVRKLHASNVHLKQQQGHQCHFRAERDQGVPAMVPNTTVVGHFGRPPLPNFYSNHYQPSVSHWASSEDVGSSSSRSALPYGSETYTHFNHSQHPPPPPADPGRDWNSAQPLYGYHAANHGYPPYMAAPVLSHYPPPITTSAYDTGPRYFSSRPHPTHESN